MLTSSKSATFSAACDLTLSLLNRQPLPHQTLIRKAFIWVRTARRPLTWPELRFVLSLDSDSWRDHFTTLCDPLLHYSAATDTFHAVDRLVYEYLCDCSQMRAVAQFFFEPLTERENWEAEIAAMCLETVADGEVARSVVMDTERWPLVAYATRYWGWHLSRVPFDEGLYERYAVFLQSERMRVMYIRRWMVSEREKGDQEESETLRQIVDAQREVRGWVAGGGKRPFSIVRDIQKAQGD